MKKIYITLFSVSFLSFYINANFCFAQNEKDLEEAIQDDRGAGTLKDYSFMADFSRQNNQAFSSLQQNYRSYNYNRENKIQSSAFSNISFFGPYNCAGRTRAFLPDETDSNLIFAGTNAGGLWKSTDAANTWNIINDQTQGMNLTCIMQNPFDANIIYYGTGEYKNRKIEDLGSGIYKSTDHGLTFSQIPSTANSSFQLINTIKHSLVDTNTIYAGTTFNGLYRSTDAGSTWQTIFNNGKSITDIECFTDGKVMFTANSDGIYYSPTGNTGSFTKATGTPAFGFSRIEMAYCDSFPLTMYATFSDSVQSYTSGLQGAYKSTDGGVTWFLITNPDNVGLYCFADQILSIVVKPDNPDFVITAGAQGCYSLNGGQSYLYLQYGRTDHHSLVFSKFNNNLLYVGNDQGINSFDCGVIPLAPVDLIHSYNTVEIWGGSYYPSGNNIFIGAQDNCFDKNNNGDSVVVRINGYGSDGKNVHVNQQDPNIAYAAGDFAEMFKCTNAMSATPVFTHILNGLDTNADGLVDDDVWHVNFFEMNYLDGNQLYLPTRDHVWRTINGGANWTKITNSFAGSNTAPHALSIGISNAVQPKVYTAGVKGFFMRIDDAYNAVAGQEADLSSSVPVELIAKGKINCLAVHPLDDGIVYATVFDDDSVSRVWKIIDANTSSPQWIDINGNLDRKVNTYWLEMDPDHPDSVLFVGTDYGLYSTVDAGTTWFRETSIPLITIFQMRLRRSDRKLFVFTFGRGVWLAQLGQGVGIDSPSFNSSVNIFPNPSYGIVQVNVVKKNVYLDGIDITDIRGRLVRKIKYDGGDNLQSTVIDINKEANGIYFLNIKTNSGDVRKKLVKL
ncbi:MAG: T9SS type A sorting domain-containing protein [Bacteroidota bacterium]